MESPSAPDLYHGRSEGTLVAQAVQLDSIPCVVRTAIDRNAFIAALRIGLPEAMKTYPNYLPILHLSAHGDKYGIQLSNNEVVAWAQLQELIEPINTSLDEALILCISACEGYSACQMAMQEGERPHPYLALVGNYGKPTWSDTAVAYSAFYHLMSKGFLVREAVEAMKAASGNDKWVIEAAAISKQAYLDYIRSVNATHARQELEAVARNEDLPPETKALEGGSSQHIQYQS